MNTTGIFPYNPDSAIDTLALNGAGMLRYKAKLAPDGKGWAMGVPVAREYVQNGRRVWSWYLADNGEESAKAFLPETLCRYTGYNDSKGNMIFVSDIVKNTFVNYAGTGFDYYGLVSEGLHDVSGTVDRLEVGLHIEWFGSIGASLMRNDFGYWIAMDSIEVVGTSENIKTFISDEDYEKFLSRQAREQTMQDCCLAALNCTASLKGDEKP